MASTLNLALIGGDGIGPEVTAEAIETLRAACAGQLDISTTEYALGANHYLETSEILSEETLSALSKHDAIVLGHINFNEPTATRTSLALTSAWTVHGTMGGAHQIMSC